MKKIDLGQSSSSRSIIAKSVAELVIIVVGVLLALAADDWWTDRQDRLEEREILEAIAQDVSATETLTHDNLETLTRILEHLRIASEGVSGRVNGMTEEELIPIFYSVLWDLPTLAVQMSSYNEIQTSGRLSLIDDPDLRRALARYDQKILSVSDRLADALQNQQTKMDPFVIANAQLAVIAQPGLEQVEGAIPLSAPSEAMDHRALLESPIFQNQIVAKYLLVSFLEEQMRELIETLDELRNATDTRLEVLN